MNPKDRVGSKKISMWVVPFVAIYHLALALMDGARKYGPYNWRDEPVQASIYFDAIQRHLSLWQSGEACAEDSGVRHLGHVMGCCAILLDAELHGKLIDDRRISPEFLADMKAFNEFVLERSKPPVIVNKSDYEAQARVHCAGGLSPYQRPSYK